MPVSISWQKSRRSSIGELVQSSSSVSAKLVSFVFLFCGPQLGTESVSFLFRGLFLVEAHDLKVSQSISVLCDFTIGEVALDV